MKSLVFALLAILGIPFARAAEEVPWTQNFVFSALPSSDSGWKPHGKEFAIEANKLVIDPQGKEYLGWIFNGGSANAAWDGSRPSTVEFRLRIRSRVAKAGGAAVTVSDGLRSYRFSFRNSEPTTYRIVLENGTASLYQAGSSEAVSKTQGKENHGEWANRIAPNAITFGKLYSNIDGVSEWEYLRWTNEGAFPP